MVISKISKITIIFLSFSLLLLLSPLETKAQDPSVTFNLSGDDMQTIYLPGPSKIHKVNVLACSAQNREGGFQLGIALLYQGTQVAYQGTLQYGRSGCPMWSYGGTAESTALDFRGTSADAVRIIPLLGNGAYYQLYVTYEEGYVPPVIKCGAENTITEYANFSVPWCQAGNFTLPAPVKIHLVNLYGCCDQNRGGGCSNNIALLYQGTQVAYQGTLRYGRSGCPMWSYGGSPTQYALNFGGVLADTIQAVPTGRCGAAIYRIFYTHEAPECNLPPPPGDFSLSLGGSVACNFVPLSWTSSSNANGYRILRGSPRVDISPYQPYTALNFTDTTVSQNTTYPYQIEAYNAAGTNRSNTINVTTPYCPPTVNLSANPTSIYQGQNTTLTWSSANSTSCTASGSWSGSKPLNGSEVVIPSPPPSATYTLTCSGPGGSGSGSATINITPLALPNWREVIPR
jgi:hypothetical protein